jgi:hypothetical protein
MPEFQSMSLLFGEGRSRKGGIAQAVESDNRIVVEFWQDFVNDDLRKD